MPDLKQALKDLVATSNSGKYTDEATLLSKFPELKGYDVSSLRDFVVTSNSGKYINDDELFSKFPEFNIVGLKKKESSTPDLQIGGENLQDGFDFSPLTFEAPSVLTPKKQKEYIAEQKLKPAPVVVETPTPETTQPSIATTETLTVGPMGITGLQRTKDYKPVEEFKGKSAAYISGELLKTLGKGVVKFPADALETIAIGASAIDNLIAKTGLTEKTEASKLATYQAAQEYRKLIDEVVPTDKDIESGFWGQSANALGQMVPIILSGFTAGGAKAIATQAAKKGVKLQSIINYGKNLASRMATPQGGLTISQVAAPSYSQAKSEGATENEALTYAGLNALLSYPIEMLPVDGLFKRLDNVLVGNRGVEILKRGVIGGSEEAITEGIQNIYENLSANQIYGTTKDFLEGTGNASAVGGTVGLITNSLLTALLGRRARATTNEEIVELDKSIEDTKKKVEQINSNNERFIETINTLEQSKPRTLNYGSAEYNFIESPEGNLELAQDDITKEQAEGIIKNLSNTYKKIEFSIQEIEPEDPYQPTTYRVVGTPIKVETTVEAPEVTQKRVDRIAEIETALAPESTIVIEDAEKTKLQTELETLKSEQDAIQKQTADEGVLRTEQPEMGLQQVGEGNLQPEVITAGTEEVIAPEGTQEIATQLNDLVNNFTTAYSQPFGTQTTSEKRTATRNANKAIKKLNDFFGFAFGGRQNEDQSKKQDALSNIKSLLDQNSPLVEFANINELMDAYNSDKQNNVESPLVKSVDTIFDITPTVSLETQPIAEQVVAEEQFVPLANSDIEFDVRFSRENASDVVDGEVETPVSDADGNEIGYLVKMVDDDKNLTFEARDENRNNLSKNEEGFETLREAEKALLDNHNKSKKKEFDREAKAKAKAKKPATPVKAEPSTETEEEQVARMTKLFEKGAEATTDSGISVTNKSQIDSIKGKVTDKLKLKVIESAQKALKTLKSVLPNFEIIIHDNEGSYNAAMIARGGVAGSSGNFSVNKKGSYSGRIDINLDRANARTVAHEVAHGIMLKTFGDTPALFKNFRDRISTVLKESTNKKLIDFAAQYEGDVTYEEYLAELIGTLEQQEENISPSILQKIAAIINAVISKITNGTFKPFEDVKNTKETIEFFSGIAKSIRQGEEIIPIDSKAMEEGVSLALGSPVIISKSQVGEKISFSKNAPALSFVTESDKIDINALINDIVEKKQKVWFWMADQLGRGNYYDEVIGGEHYLDAGPSFALDPINRDKGILWASGLPEKTLNNQIAKADYIFFISGSPEKAKLFNKRVLELVAERINKTSNFNTFKDAINKFKKETVELTTMRDAIKGINSFKELADSPKRKSFLLSLGEISELKTTPAGSLKELLGSFNAFIDYNELRDGFYKENEFTQNDIMLVGKPTELGGKAPHSTYEFAIRGEVVGVPDKKIDSWNIMPESLKEKYKEGNKFIDEKTGKEKIRKEVSIAQKAKIVAAETGVIRELESQAANRVKDLGGLLGFDLGKPVSKSQISNTPLPVNTEVANGYDVLKKKFGETAARAIRENIPFALDYPTEFAEFINKKIPVKEDIAFVVKNLSERLDGLFRLESDKNIETVKVKNKTPEELSKEAGYVFHRPESENDILAFKKDFENGEVLCTYNDVEGRMQGHFIFWIRRNDAESVLPAKKITQEYLKDDSEGSSLWRGYLDAKGLKMPDGSYDISNLNASRQDPYGTSSMSVQIGRRGGNISIKNRYNHTVNNPDATFGNDLNTIIDGLNDAVFGIEGLPKKTNQELQLPNNITSDSKGRFFKYDQEIENIYVSQHGYVEEGVITLIDKSYQRMIDNFVFDSKNNKVIPITIGRKPIDNITNVNFEKNKITVDSEDGKFEFELLNGFLNKLESNTEIIDDGFLRYNTTLESISLPNVIEIGNGFLNRNISLQNISLPNVKEIGSYFIADNQDLKSISLPNVEKIGSDFLRRNENLESISLPNVERIGSEFLNYNENLRSISLPNVKFIGDSFLRYNNDLKSISLPNVEYIEENFLNMNDLLESISLPNVKEIGGYFMRFNRKLRSISLPNVEIIRNSFLSSNSVLESISLPNVKEIYSDFLNNNDLLENISLPNVKEIGSYFMSRSTILSNIELPNVTNIKSNFLMSNNSLRSISLPNVIEIGSYFISRNRNLDKISLPNVKFIGIAFLNDNEKVESISLPNAIDIGDYFMINNESVERPSISKSQISSNNEINAAVNNFRTQGFSESAIKAFLIQQGYSATESNQIMNIGPIQEEFNSLMDKVDKLIARQKSRGIVDSKITSNIDTFIRKQDEYINANDAQKKIIEREARGKMGAAPKRAVSIGRVLGALKDITNISRAEKLKIINQIRQLSKDSAKDLAKEIRSMASSGKITANQAANIVARFGKVNMLSEISVSKFVDYMAKVFANAEYAAKLSSARSLKKDISKLSKDKNKNANLKDLGSKFIKIDPSMVEDIDAYNDMASKIKEAIKGSTVRVAKVKFADTVNIENATEYINKTIEAQEEMIRQEKAAEIQDLMDVDVSDLSYEDMILMLDSDKPITKYNEGIIRGAINKAFKVYSSIIKNTISTGKDPFTDEDVTFTKNEKRIVTAFMNMDLNQLEPKEALKAVDALVNFLQNNSIARMDTVVAEYNALVNSKKLVEDGVKARELKKYGLKGLGKLLAEQTTTLPVLFEKMFPGVNRSSFVRKMMGLTKLFNESASAKTEAKNIVNDYIKNFYKKKANGEAFNTVENNIERDMAARLIRTVIGTEAQMQAEFDRRKEVLKESIAMLSEGNEQEVAKSILYQKVYDKLVGPSTGVNQNQKIDNEATNIQEVRDRVDKTNLEAIDFWIKNWGDRYDRFSEVSEGVYNTILEKELNYTPDKYSLLSLYSKDVDLNNEESAFNKNTGQEYKKSGTLNKVNQPVAEDLRKSNRYLNLDFDQNMANLMQDALIDINTAASIKQVMAFLNSPNFRKIFPNQDDATIIKGKDKTVGRVQLYINNLRSKNDFTTDELSSAMKKLDKVAALGVSFALGGVGQVPKQTFSVSVNTLFNSGSLPDLSILTNIDKMNFINNSGRDIANRGASSQTEIESINKLIEKAASSTGEKAMRFIEKINEKWLNLFLINSDVFIAKASWLTYYEQSLKKQGIDTSGLDYKTHELNDKAADYASAQVGRQQNISDHDMAGKLFSNQNEFAKFVVKTVFSFASFRMNAASRLGADLTTLNDKTSTKEDRIIALRSIAAYGPELAMFSLVSIALNVLLGSLTKFISGDEEDEDELKKRIKLASKSRLSSAPSDILSPLPIFDPFIQKYIAAPILEKIEELTNLPVSIYDKPNNSGLFSEFGVLGIASERISKIIELGKLAATGKYTDDYGNENTISEEKRKTLAMFVPLSILSSVGLLPQEGNTIAMNAMKYAKSKTLGDTALARRALKDWASMVDLNEYPQVAEFIKNKGEELSGSGAEFRKIKERNDLKKSLLEGYESETQMQEVDPELYQKNFGEESDWVKNGYSTEDIIYSELNSELNTMINELKTQELRKKVND